MTAHTRQRPISIAIHAMGGQGGGVLADWIAELALKSGYAAQTTSVPGVAQRTGATVYYVEIAPKPADNSQLAFALMPVPGDVDIVIAAELMEAGRALLRGFVTPDRTTLIASSQRDYAVIEKEVPGDGTADGNVVLAAIARAAKKHVVADFAAIADTSDSMISSALFGALAATKALPFPRTAFEATLRNGGAGSEANVKCFAAAFTLATTPPTLTKLMSVKHLPELPDLTHKTGQTALDTLVLRIRRECPEPTQQMAYAGARHLVDYQDATYASDYITRLARIAVVDRAAGGAARGYVLTTEVAKQLARAMAYDDIIRVADLKTRIARRDRVARETRTQGGGDLLQTTEFFHPRMEEICSILPVRLGTYIERSPQLFRAMNRLVDRGRRVRTDTIWGFTTLYIIAGRRKRRRNTLRYGREMAQISIWLETVLVAAPSNYALAVEMASTRRLVKGYSDTMARGQSKFARVMAAASELADRPDAADWVRRLRQAALLDEGGLALDGALKTLASISEIDGSVKKTTTQ
jgi:indolepyruvate ferredoxin oxidoreductase, beta subunit